MPPQESTVDYNGGNVVSLTLILTLTLMLTISLTLSSTVTILAMKLKLITSPILNSCTTRQNVVVYARIHVRRASLAKRQSPPTTRLMRQQ